MIRVLLVDDQQVVREGLRSLIATDPGLTVVGECADGDEVVDQVARCSPEVVVMDIRMRRIDGATATAAGFVLKSAPGEDILRAISTVAAGDAWIDPQVAGRVLAAYRGHLPPEPADLSVLTERELDVLRVVGRGRNNREAAAELFVSEATLKTHLGRVLSKLGLRDRCAAIVFAHDHQLV